MLLVDERAGSKNLIAPLKRAGLPVEGSMLEFGDIAFEGRGVGGAPLWVGIEFKQLTELGDAIKGRLPGHQLPGMVQSFERRYLLVEGDWHTDAAGRLLRKTKFNMWATMPGMPPAAEVQKRLLTYAVRGGLSYWGTSNRTQTVEWLTALYHFWTDKDLDEHKSHLAVYNRDVDSRLQMPTTQFRQTVSTFPGVGREFLDAAERRFPTVAAAVSGRVTDWAEIEAIDRSGKTKRFGTKRATKLVDSLHIQ